MTRSHRTVAARPARALLAAWVTAWALVCGGCGVFGGSPRTDALAVAYAGNVHYDADDLDRVVARLFEDFATTKYEKSAVDDAAFDLERHYVAAGFPFARVGYRYVERGADRPIAYFQIDEGPRTKLGAVTFEGESALSRRELEAFFRPPATGLLEESDDWYVEGRVRAALDEVVVALRAKGFLDARATVAAVTFADARTRADVHVRITPGVPYRVVSVDVEGGDPRVPADEVDRLARSFVGRPFQERLTNEIQGRIEERFAASGFADVRVERTRRETTAEGTVALGYRVVPGPRVTVGPVTVSGNERAREGFVRSRLALTEGEPWSREEERASYAHLFQSGVFDRVTLRGARAPDERPDATDVVRPLEVEVGEARAIELFLEPGWGSYEDFRVSAGARHKNLFGTGRILDLHGTLSVLSQSGTLALIDPWLFGEDVVAEASVFGTRREEPSFLRTELGVGATLTRRFSRGVEGLVGYRLRASDARDVQVLDDEARDAIANVDISEVQASVAWDTRDNVFQPTGGFFAKAGVEYAGAAVGSELEFARARFQYAGFAALDRATVLGWSVRTGVVQPLAATDSIPLQERFFNGGENSVRSFRESELGPKDDTGEPLGGEAFSTFNLEIRRRLKGRLDGAAFWDVGNVVPRHEDVFEFNEMQQGFGLGLRYSLPVGPIRLDAAWNPDPGDFESRVVVHLSLGLAF